MKGMPLPDQLAKLKKLSQSCTIPRSDHYLSSYPYLVESIKKLDLEDPTSIVLIGHAAFGWMPAILSLDSDKLMQAQAILQKAKQSDIILKPDEIKALANIFRTKKRKSPEKGDSVVGASKVLHFINPKVYPIWDSKVAKRWGASPHGKKAASEYCAYTVACGEWKDASTGKAICESFKRKFKARSYDYEMSNLRILELILFLS